MRDDIKRIGVEVRAGALGVEQIGRDRDGFDPGATAPVMPDVRDELRRHLDREISPVDRFEFHAVSPPAADLAGAPLAPPALTSNRARRCHAARDQEGPP